ncbi:MAG TPA: fused MFS/spermidine synthase [Thermoanaerobaculia bacterium]|jgi:spermidine synthase|nr:fused MFS/spermidine synthase [Thermoanaerobaculia bacterium]
MLSRLRFYWVVAVSGGVLMALEILSSRVLAPHFGNSVYVWGSIISVFLAALSLGYLWGGRLADRRPSVAALGPVLALAASCQAALLLFGTRLAAALAGLTGGTPAGTLLAASILFGPASVLLATVSPWAVRLAARDLGHLGNTAGQLFALSTIGSLAGTLACTFLLIPFLELRQILGLLTAVTAATACVAITGSFRSQAPTTVLAVFLLVLAVPGASFAPRGASDLVYERVTPYQTLQVREREGVRFLEGDRVPQAAIDLADGESAMPYTRAVPAALLLKPDIRRAALIGLGGGIVGRYLSDRLPGLTIDYVDVDPAVPDIARRFFRFRKGPRMRVAVADGRQFLQRSSKTWDFIYCDAYIGQSVPFHLTTLQFLDVVGRHLEPGGLFGLNLAAGLDDPFSQAIYRTVRARFNLVYVFKVRRAPNVLLLASQDPISLAPAELTRRGRELDRRFHFEPPLATLASWRSPVELDMTKIPILTDELAPVDRLIRLGSAARKEG